MPSINTINNNLLINNTLIHPKALKDCKLILKNKREEELKEYQKMALLDTNELYSLKVLSSEIKVIEDIGNSYYFTSTENNKYLCEENTPSFNLMCEKLLVNSNNHLRKIQ